MVSSSGGFNVTLLNFDAGTSTFTITLTVHNAGTDMNEFMLMTQAGVVGSCPSTYNIMERNTIDTSAPVNLTNFSASHTDNRSVNILWATGTEYNNDYFEVQRSTDGNQWDALGIVPGHGTTLQPQTYSYTDGVKSPGTYCIALFKLTLMVRCSTAQLFSVVVPALHNAVVYPNPASSILYIDAHTPSTVIIVDQSGRTVLTTDEICTRCSVDVSALPKGVYIVAIRDEFDALRETRR